MTRRSKPSPSRSKGLKAGGAEVAWIETMSAPDEIRAAAEAAISVGLPYTYTGSFDTAGRTMMGLLPKDIHGVVDGLSAGAARRSAPIAASAPPTSWRRCST